MQESTFGTGNILLIGAAAVIGVWRVGTRSIKNNRKELIE